jgi:hypothetical protein
MYSYDLLENLFGADIHTLDRVMPELQAIKPGDRSRLFPHTGRWISFWRLRSPIPNRVLVLRGPGTPQQAVASGMGARRQRPRRAPVATAEEATMRRAAKAGTGHRTDMRADADGLWP